MCGSERAERTLRASADANGVEQARRPAREELPAPPSLPRPRLLLSASVNFSVSISRRLGLSSRSSWASLVSLSNSHTWGLEGRVWHRSLARWVTSRAPASAQLQPPLSLPGPAPRTPATKTDARSSHHRAEHGPPSFPPLDPVPSYLRTGCPCGCGNSRHKGRRCSGSDTVSLSVEGP